MSSPTFVGELFVYGANGDFRRSVGRKGSGPGEFDRVQLLAFDALDSLHAVASGGGRYSVLSPGLDAVPRSVALPSRVMTMRVESSGSLFAVAPSVREGSGTVLQAIGGDGRTLLSFDAFAEGGGRRAAMGRAIALDPSGNRWSSEISNYRLKQWDRDGKLLRELEAEREWLSPVLPDKLDISRRRPPAQIGGLEVDEAGLLWLFVIVPDAEWRPAPQGQRPDVNSVFDTRIEVIDPATGKLLAVGSSKQMVLPFQTGLAYSLVEEPGGDLRLQIWEMAVTGR